MDSADVDSSRLSAVTGKRFTVHLENKSTALQPNTRVRKSDNSIAQGWTRANAVGADLTLSIRPNLGGTVSSKLALTGIPTPERANWLSF
jgi:hypothetical protein